MDEKKDSKKEVVEEVKSEKDRSLFAKKLLNCFLILIVIVTVGVGAVIYYSLYTYSNEEIIDNTDINNTSMVDIINTAISPEVTGNTTPSSENITTITTGEADSRKVLNESIIVLYDGLVLETDETGIVELKYIDNTNDLKEKYVITYYNYENYGFKDSTLGTLSQQVLEGLVKIDNVGKVSISEKYDAIPREIQVINTVPSIVLDNNKDLSNYDTAKTLIVDLDGNGTNEYIVIVSNKQSGESKIVLFESTGIVKNVLGTMNKSGWDANTPNGYYLSYTNIEVVDIDNDGIMEILFELPTLEAIPSQVSVLKYTNGELFGKTNIECSLIKQQ